MAGERILPECIVPTVKFGGAGVMLWGYFFWYGTEPFVTAPCILNTESYFTILDNHALPMLWECYGGIHVNVMMTMPPVMLRGTSRLGMVAMVSTNELACAERGP